MSRRIVLAVASLLMLAAVVTGYLVVQGRSETDLSDSAASSSAVVAARQAAISFFTLDPENVEDQVDAVLDQATGKFLREYTEQRGEVVANVRSRKRTVSATVSEGGTALADFSGKTATVLVAVDVTSKEGAASASTAQYRMLLVESRDGDGWQTSTLDQLAAVPGPGTFTPGDLPNGGTGVVTATAKAVTAMLSYDHRSLDKDLEATLPLLTGSFGAEFAQTWSATVRPLALRKKAVTAAYVRAVGVVVREKDKAKAMVFVDQVLDPTGSATVTEARLFVELRLQSGTWKVDGLSRVGEAPAG